VRSTRLRHAAGARGKHRPARLHALLSKDSAVIMACNRRCSVHDALQARDGFFPQTVLLFLTKTGAYSSSTVGRWVFKPANSNHSSIGLCKTLPSHLLSSTVYGHPLVVGSLSPTRNPPTACPALALYSSSPVELIHPRVFPKVCDYCTASPPLAGLTNCSIQRSQNGQSNTSFP
jgi:hypothetical protein